MSQKRASAQASRAVLKDTKSACCPRSWRSWLNPATGLLCSVSSWSHLLKCWPLVRVSVCLPLCSMEVLWHKTWLVWSHLCLHLSCMHHNPSVQTHTMDPSAPVQYSHCRWNLSRVSWWMVAMQIAMLQRHNLKAALSCKTTVWDWGEMSSRNLHLCWIPTWVGLRIGNLTVYHVSRFSPSKECEDPSSVTLQSRVWCVLQQKKHLIRLACMRRCRHDLKNTAASWNMLEPPDQ
jgi:hypothetical protein